MKTRTENAGKRFITRAAIVFLFALITMIGKPATAKAAVTITWTGAYASGVSQNNATLGIRVNSSVRGRWTGAGAVLYNSKGRAIASKTESANYYLYYMNIWYDIAGEMRKTLSPNTKYYIRFSAVFNGKRYYSKYYYFRTAAVPKGRVAKMNAFIRDSRWKNGISWPARGPKLSTYRSSGCCAYAADFVRYVYNSNNMRCGKLFYNPSQIKAGDVIHLSNHWFVVIARNGNWLTTAEGNCSSRVRVASNVYYINGNRLGGSSQAFVYGYHYY